MQATDNEKSLKIVNVYYDSSGLYKYTVSVSNELVYFCTNSEVGVLGYYYFCTKFLLCLSQLHR